jgi:hypothetical protein
VGTGENAKIVPSVNVIEKEHFVEDGDVITTAGIDMDARHHGELVARATAWCMEYPLSAGNQGGSDRLQNQGSSKVTASKLAMCDESESHLHDR